MTCFYVHDPALSLVPLPRDVVVSSSCSWYPSKQYISPLMWVCLLERETSTSPRKFSTALLGLAILMFFLMTLLTLICGFMLVVEASTVRKRSSVIGQMHAIRIGI